MPVQLPELTKRYYTTGEVAKIFGVPRNTIRAWEEKFDMVRATKSGKGERRFTADQVRLIQKVHHLIKERGFTVPGARLELAEHKTWYRGKDKILERLKTLKEGLEELKMEI